MRTSLMILEAAEILGWAGREAHDEGLTEVEKRIEEAVCLLIKIVNEAREEAGR